MEIEIEVLEIAFHRNGICGEPFHVVLFTDDSGEGGAKLAIVFAKDYHVAVLDIARLAELNVKFRSNSWRGDRFEPALREAIAERRNAKPTSTKEE